MWRTPEPIDTTLHALVDASAGATWGFAPPAANDLRPLTLSPGCRPGTTALIRRAGLGPASAGKARACEWVLGFQPVSAQFVEPLMGWCGGDDPLRHVELRFPTRDAAVRYAERQGLAYEVNDPPAGRRAVARCPDQPAGLWTQWMLECLGVTDVGARSPANTDARPAGAAEVA